jgi:hypothetical protein
MPCQILTSGLKAKATPAGALALSATPIGNMADNPRPQDSGWCQVYQFAVAAQLIVTFNDVQMITFSGNDLATFSSI